MKCCFTLAALLALSSLAYSQTYIQAVRGPFYSNARRMIRTADGGWLIAGVAGDNSFDNTTYDMYVLKFSATGRRQWAGRFGNTGVYEEATSVIQTRDKGYLLSGFSNDIYYQHIGALVKLDSVGTKMWSKTFIGNLPLSLVSSVQTADGGYLAGGNYIVNGNNQPVLMKLTAEGTVTKYIKPVATAAILRKIIKADNGDIVMLLDEATGGNKKILVERVTASGTVVWAKRFGGVHAETGADLIETRDGGFAITGSNSNGSNGTTYMATLIKLNGNGSVAWYRSVNTDITGGGVTVSGYSLLEDTDGSFVACGTVYRNLAPGSLNIYLLRCSSTGAYLSSSYIGLPNSSNGNDDYGRGILKVRDGYVVASTSLAYGNSIVVLKADTSFNFCQTPQLIVPAKQDTSFTQSDIALSFGAQPGITDTDALFTFATSAGLQNECSTEAVTAESPFAAKPATTQELKIYPNPVAAVLNLSFTNNHTEKGMLQVYDVAGNRYLHKTISIVAGANSSRIDVSSLRSGHYKILLTCTEGVLTKSFYKQ